MMLSPAYAAIDRHRLISNLEMRRIALDETEKPKDRRIAWDLWLKGERQRLEEKAAFLGVSKLPSDCRSIEDLRRFVVDLEKRGS